MIQCSFLKPAMRLCKRLVLGLDNLNRFGLGPLDALCDAAQRIRDTVVAGDEEAFVELMEKGRDYLATRS